MSEHARLLQELIRNACVNDGSGDACEEPNADLLGSLLEGTGMDVEYYDSAAGRRSVVARLPGSNRLAPSLMLLGHTDVVPAAGAGWRHDPFGGELIDGFVWGRGALDMLGHLATMTLALRDYCRSGDHRGGDLVLAMVADEEALGSHGMEWLQQHHADAVSADWVVTESGGTVSGPPEDRRITALAAEKGVWRLEVSIRTPPGHSSLPQDSPSALEVAAEVITRLRSFQPSVVVTPEWAEFLSAGWDPSVVKTLLDPRLVDATRAGMPQAVSRIVAALTRMTIAVTSVATDTSWNSLPSLAVLTLDVRSLPGQSRDDVIDTVTRALGDSVDGLQVEVVAGTEATGSPSSGPLWDLLQAAATRQTGRARLVPSMAPGATDARFMRQRGSVAYGFGLLSQEFPSHEIPSMMHGVNERIDVTSLDMMRQLWGDLLVMFADETSRH